MSLPAAPRGSLRVRLLTGTLVWVIATIVIAGWGLSSLFRQHVELQFNAELKTHLAKRKKKLDIEAFSKKLPEELKTTLDELYLWDLEYVIENEPVLERELNNTVEKIKKDTAKRDMKELSTRIKQAEATKNKKELTALTKEFQELSEKLK